jgi:hypothetical protein
VISLEEVGFLKNNDVDQLIQSVPRPGGMHSITIAAVPEVGTDGQAGHHAAVAQVIEWVLNRGIPVTQRSVMHIKLLIV